MAPAPPASGATRGSSETDELLVKDASASRGADVRDVDGRRSSAARTAARVAAVGACALVGVAAVSGDVFGHLAGVASFGGSDDRARLGERPEGRWATAFDLADDSAFSLRDGKRGAWGAARGIVGAAPRGEADAAALKARRGGEPLPVWEGPETRRAGWRSQPTSSVPRLKSAPALPEKKPSRFQKWDREPYEYEMPARFAAAALGDAPVDRGSAASSTSDAGFSERTTPKRTPERGAADDEISDSEAYEYEENYDNDGSVPWDVVYAPPPVPSAPGKPPVPAAPRKPTSDEVAAIGKASASTSTYYPYHDRVVRAAPWGARSTPSSANDGALKPREPDAEAAKAAQAARAARRAKEERWKQLEADGGKLTIRRDGEKDEPSPREEKTRSVSSKRPSSVSSAPPEKARAKTETRETRGGDYDDAWLGDVRAKGTMNRAEKKQSVLSEREFRETFVGADYDDDVSSRKRSSRGEKEMTEEEIASARAGGLMASLGAKNKKATSADVESYEADLAAGRVFASPEEEAEAKAEAKARYEAEVARETELERARNADGSIRWDAPREVREALEAEAANVDAKTRDGAVSDAQTVARKKKFGEGERPTRSRAVNPDGSVPWDAPEVPTYVFNEELRSRLGGEEGEDTSLAWDAKPESELVSSFVSAKEETSGGDDGYDPQDSDEGAVAWTVAFDADAAAGDGALDAARLAEEAYDPSQSDHYLDDLLRPSDELLDAGVFGDEVAAVGKPRRNEGAKHTKERADAEEEESVSWNDERAWRSAVTGEAPEDEDASYQDAPYRDEAADTSAEHDAEDEDDHLMPAHESSSSIEFDTRDYDVGALGMRTRFDARLEPQSYEDELVDIPHDEKNERRFRAAALGDALLSPTNENGINAARRSDHSDHSDHSNAVCELISDSGGPHRDESLCQKYAGDKRACQTYVAPTQSCWHKTVGGSFLDPASSDPALGARHGRGPLTGGEDPVANAKWRKQFYDCMAGDPKFTGAVEAPYRLPLAPSHRSLAGAKTSLAAEESPAPPLTEKFFRARPGTAYFYHFVHVPKAGGTYFKSLLHASETRRQQRLGGPDPRWDASLVKTWNTKPLVDMTEASFANVAWRYVEGAKRGAAIRKLANDASENASEEPPAFDARLGRAERDTEAFLGASTATPQFTGPGMRASYRQGHRAVSKGSLSMGACDMVDAPCAYLTVLRDPWEKFMSFYQYACLEGSENRGSWTEEWRRDASAMGYDVHGCPASPTQFYRDVGGMVEVLAPGAAPDSQCAVEAAKRNLASPCMRFLLLENLEEGLKFMRDSLPDFADIGAEHLDPPAGDAAAAAQARMVNSHRNGSSERMDDAKKKRLDAYKADENEMRELRRLMAGELEVYRFAKEERYLKQWEEPLRTC